VDARAVGKVTLVQLTDQLAMVSLSQLDLIAEIGGTNSILKLFAARRPEAHDSRAGAAFAHGSRSRLTT
jgi:hypothetical protein